MDEQALQCYTQGCRAKLVNGAAEQIAAHSRAAELQACVSSAPVVCSGLCLLTAAVLCCATLCRDLALIFGGLMQLSVFLPTLRHFRIINILGLFGTTYTAW